MSVDESAVEAIQGFAGSPQLFIDENRNPVRKNDRTGVRKFLECRYEDAISTIFDDDTLFDVVIKDSLQDIFTQPRRGDRNFPGYFNLFRILKIETSFQKSQTICVVFDVQNGGRVSMKDNTRKKETKE